MAATELLTEKSTNYASQAVPTSDSESRVDLASLPPYDGFEWRGLLWPEVGNLDLTVMEGSKEIKLMNYRWAPTEGERKGVIFLIHGYGSCAPQNAILAKYMAQEGYEVHAIDMRGHGDSQGFRGDFLDAE